MIDSQSVKTTESGGVRGYDAGKKIKGRKRHIVTDTCGFLIFILVTQRPLFAFFRGTGNFGGDDQRSGGYERGGNSGAAAPQQEAGPLIAAFGAGENDTVVGYFFLGTPARELDERPRPEYDDVVRKWEI